ncbi:MAG: ATP-binding cassette domain-containing protein, partial [Candidatus Thorarchaeota archaeon]
MADGEPLLKIKNLRAYYMTKQGLLKAVDDVSMEIMPGECVGLLGESGCGKSTLALAILQLFNKIARFAAGTTNIPGLRQEFDKAIEAEYEERPGSQGSVLFRGRELSELDEEDMVKVRGQEISMIPQGLTHALNPQYSVGWQTGEPIEIHEENIRLIELKEKVLEFLDLVAIADTGTRYVLDPGSFSGGEAQRILIALSLISGPYLVIADEPTS